MKPKLLVILGTTSTGKTDLAIHLAQKLGGELISADSRQVYKYLDIGTGKLPGSYKTLVKADGYWEIDGIKIKLYDVLAPNERFNLYQYILKAEQETDEITSSKKLPILVGGTGLYIRSLIEGISDFGSTEDPDLRMKLEALDTVQLKNKIQQVDPQVLKTLNDSDSNNKRRLIRLYEKLTSSGNISSFPGLKDKFDVLKIGLRINRDKLRDRIRKRLISRINDGMIQESKSLLEKGILTHQRMDELGLEYRYLSKFLRAEIETINELIEILTTKISQFAKRQETWFKKEKDVFWFDISETNYETRVEKEILDWYNGPK